MESVSAHSELAPQGMQPTTLRRGVLVHVNVDSLQLFAPQRVVSVSGVHATHWPEASLHTGVLPKRAQSLSDWQPPHVFVCVLQTGALVVPQSLVSRQPTHAKAPMSQT